MSQTRTHPRRTQHVVEKTLPTMSGIETQQQTRSLQKGSTFHASKSPSSPSRDPVLNVRGVPARSPTSPQNLEELVTEYAALRASTDKEYATWLNERDSADPKDLEAFSVPPFMTASKKGSANGLGSSIASESDDENVTHLKLLADRSSMGKTSVFTPRKVASSVASGDAGDERPFLSTFATEKVKQFVVDPLLAEDKVKDFHQLVASIPSRISARKITCLRDLEKTLIFCAPVSSALALSELDLAKHFLVLARQASAKTAASYLQFCETSIQCIHTTVEHVNDLDKQRPTDRPYSNNYFLDLISQVRQYAGIMASSRAKQAEGKPTSSTDYTTDEKVVLDGGEGKPARLVRIKDGKEIPIETDEIELARADGEDETERSMARKRKCDIGKEVWHACRECGKQFTRPCDLTKHEKTHSRPWKCPAENCKYHVLGWPTEKECDRHFNDKHTSTPSLYQCLYEGCTYTSKRESNCKQHMEKTHGYEYVRSKSKKAARLVPSSNGEPTAMLTPNSAINSIPTPSSSNFMSPQLAQINELSPPATDDAPSPFNGDMQTMSLFSNNAGAGDFFNGQGAANQFSPASYSTTPNEAVVTPALTFSDIDPTVPEDAWNLKFDFDDIANTDDSFPSPEEFFQQYTIGKQDPVQQPTPEMSDFDLSKDMTHQFGTMDAGAMGSMTATAQQQNPMLNPGAPSLGNNALGGDFSLFADNSNPMANTFSDLAGNGGQFYTERKPRTVWDEWNDA